MFENPEAEDEFWMKCVFDESSDSDEDNIEGQA